MPDTSETTFMFVHCLTAIHPGSGTALGVVDLPVQRERHTQWPTIPGSTLKGVLRASNGAEAEDWVQTVFGPATHHADDHAGALTISDARVLAFPVRSLKGVFAWISCPSVLDRLQRDLKIMRCRDDRLSSDKWKGVGDNAVLCAEDSPLLIEGDGMLLEEFDFKRTGAAPDVANWVAENAVVDTATAVRVRSHFAIVHDDAFGHFVRHATEVSARIALDADTRTVKPGALFWEEHLPPETLFYALVTSSDSRRKGDSTRADEVLERLRTTLPGMLQIGGNATLGKGLCAVSFATVGGKV
ncbi:MAG: type III-B CRISPR module RAMP protein Cmr4 [Hyphomonadaceae bacterium]|nr:type III-B CRISPR module RAMP protein Cmr4 [Hyphomonadaceae bacterium]MBC6412341.1 type III-B CRISPR module RAMP protein Cmr4 [Hyphomonadaceae bacterium]